jgi:hypothetical protein
MSLPLKIFTAIKIHARLQLFHLNDGLINYVNCLAFVVATFTNVYTNVLTKPNALHPNCYDIFEPFIFAYLSLMMEE